MSDQSDLKVSICIPSSSIREQNSLNLFQATTVAYQIARLATIFHVVEVIVLDIPEPRGETKNSPTQNSTTLGNKIKFSEQSEAPSHASSSEIRGKDSFVLATLLQFFVTPPYLVKALFKPSERKLLKHAMKLPKLTCLPIMNAGREHQFREGLSIPKRTPKSNTKGKKTKPLRKLQVTRYVNIGASKPMILDQDVPVNVRLTVDLRAKKVVSPQIAYNCQNRLFAYTVRYARTISSIFTELCISGGYTETVFVGADDFFQKCDRKFPKFTKHQTASVLLLIGSWKDFELCTKGDPNISSISDLVDCELKVPSGLRIEDAAFISLTKLSETE